MGDIPIQAPTRYLCSPPSGVLPSQGGLAGSVSPSVSPSPPLLVSQCFPPSLPLSLLASVSSISFCFPLSFVYIYTSSFPLTFLLAQSTTAILASKFIPVSKPPDAHPACLLTSLQSLLKCHLFREAYSGFQTLLLLILYLLTTLTIS